jgi:hypothetical protein
MHPSFRCKQLQVDPPTNTVQHRGIVGLVFLGHVHEVGILLASLEWT